jgi:hypothetical protein
MQTEPESPATVVPSRDSLLVNARESDLDRLKRQKAQL